MTSMLGEIGDIWLTTIKRIFQKYPADFLLEYFCEVSMEEVLQLVEDIPYCDKEEYVFVTEGIVKLYRANARQFEASIADFTADIDELENLGQKFKLLFQ